MTGTLAQPLSLTSPTHNPSPSHHLHTAPLPHITYTQPLSLLCIAAQDSGQSAALPSALSGGSRRRCVLQPFLWGPPGPAACGIDRGRSEGEGGGESGAVVQGSATAGALTERGIPFILLIIVSLFGHPLLWWSLDDVSLVIVN